MTVARPHRGTGLDHAEVLTLAHELRGALTVIAGYTELLKRPLDEPERRTSLEGIERAVKRADALIAHAIGNDEGTSMVPLDLAELAERVGDEQRAATGRDIAVSAHAHPVIHGDADALARLLGNLIDNAAKYSTASTTVDVVVEEGAGAARISVLDRGPGIAEADRDRAFRRFERLAPHADVAGSGVGLAVVREVAVAHGGRAWIEDRQGGGTCVVLELPLGR